MLKKAFILLSGFILLSCNRSKTGAVTIQAENITATPDQAARRKQSEFYCQAHHVPVYGNPHALFVDAEDSVSIRKKDEIVDRALALYYIALKSEGIKQAALGQIDQAYHISSKLSPAEQVFAKSQNPTDQQKADANWRYEDLHVMLWALGFIDSLNYPDNLCNVAEDTKIIVALTEKQFRGKAKLRSKKEILDQADLILRLDWACVDARTKNLDAPGSLNKEVVYERHYALNWLINYAGQSWDEVSTDT